MASSRTLGHPRRPKGRLSGVSDTFGQHEIFGRKFTSRLHRVARKYRFALTICPEVSEDVDNPPKGSWGTWAVSCIPPQCWKISRFFQQKGQKSPDYQHWKWGEGRTCFMFLLFCPGLELVNSTIKSRPNDRNMPTQRIATFLGATCYVRLATVWRHVGCSWPKFEPTTTNMSQHITTRWPNAHNMLRPTMLRYVKLACVDRLAGA